MVGKIKKQSLKKLFIMLWNIIRMCYLHVRFGSKAQGSLVQNIHPTTEIAIEKGVLQLSHSIFTRKNVSFRVVAGQLSIGTSFFNQGCSVTAMQCIRIGNNCLFGPNVVIVDHDHNYKYLDNQRGNHYLTGDVVIEDNVWIGANVTILRGTVIGENSVVGAGTVIKGVYPANSLIMSDNRSISVRQIRRKQDE